MLAFFGGMGKKGWQWLGRLLKTIWRWLSWKRVLILGIVGFVSGLLFIVSINLYIVGSTRGDIHTSLDSVPTQQTGLLLGALVHSDGSLSTAVQDRVDTTVELYRDGKISKILVSGDHGQVNYDEVNTIRKHLMAKGVKEEDIFLDHAGFDTYDSVYRARDVFQVKSIVIISQAFHLPRAVFVAKALDVDAVGYVADKQDYPQRKRNTVREWLARIKSWKDVVVEPQPTYLGETIPITGDSKKSWDEK